MVEVYIGDKKLNLFDDENIFITGKLVDIEQLSNVFNDFSNTFTVPADEHNNIIFKHYYDDDIDNGFNANIAVSSSIYLQGSLFKFGKMILEEATIENGSVKQYKINFTGGLKQLKDLFKDDLIADLDYDTDDNGAKIKNRTDLSQFDILYTKENLVALTRSNDYKDGEVIIPLIAYANRDWNLGSLNATDLNIHPITEDEIRPALRIINIINAIQNKYNIGFSNDFFGKATFLNIFMWLNKRTESKTKSIVKFTPSVDFVSSIGTNTRFSFEGDFLKIKMDKYNPTGPKKQASWTYGITPSSSANYDVTFYDYYGNIIKSEKNISGYKEFHFGKLSGWRPEITDFDQFYFIYYRLEITSYESMTADVAIAAKYFIKTYPSATIINQVLSDANPIDLQLYDKIEDNIPTIKVLDFIQNLMKLFKLIIRPLSSNIFYINTLDGYYADGKILNITEYVDKKSITKTKPLIYNKLKFKFKETSNVLGQKFRELDPKKEVGYGDLVAEYKTIENKEELTIEPGFENMLFEQLVDLSSNEDTDIMIGQAITSSDNYVTFNKNNCGPILFYNNGITIHEDYGVKLHFESSTFSTTYTLYTSHHINNSNDKLLEQVTDTLNFNSEYDPYFKSIVSNTLYLNYWDNWIKTIYDLKQRKTKLSAFIPQRYIEELSLNDRLIYDNVRYKISEFKMNLTTGESEFILFKDIFEFNAVPEFDTSSIIANHGKKYYDIQIHANGDWSIEKSDTGDGVDFVTILTSSGYGNSSALIRVEKRSLDYLAPIKLNLIVTIDGVQYIKEVYQL